MRRTKKRFIRVVALAVLCAVISIDVYALEPGTLEAQEEVIDEADVSAEELPEEEGINETDPSAEEQPDAEVLTTAPRETVVNATDADDLDSESAEDSLSEETVTLSEAAEEGDSTDLPEDGAGQSIAGTAALEVETGIVDDTAITWERSGNVLTFSGSGELKLPYYGINVQGEFDTVVIGDGITSLGTHCFDYWSSLKSVQLGAGLTSISEGAFFGSALESVTIPSTIRDIGNSAFSYCEHLQKVTLSSGLKTIGQEAFSGCSVLEEITIPETVETIGDMAFYQCASLKKVIIQEGQLRRIPSNFLTEIYGNAKLAWIAIPANVTEISYDFFGGSAESTEDYPWGLFRDIYFGGSRDQWQSIKVGNLTMGEEMDQNSYLKGVTIHYYSEGPDSGTVTPEPIEHKDFELYIYSVPEEPYHGIYLSWYGVDADRYEIYRRSSNESPDSLMIAFTVGKSNTAVEYDVERNLFEWTDTDVTDNTIYYYTVRAYDQNNEGWNSSTAKCSITGKVDNLKAEINKEGKAVKLSWNAVPNVRSYSLHRSPAFSDGSNTISLPQSTSIDCYGNVNTETIYHDTDIESYRKYRYSITAYSDEGPGAASDEIMIDVGKLWYQVPEDTWSFGNDTVRNLAAIETFLDKEYEERLFEGLSDPAASFLRSKIRTAYNDGLCMGFSITSILHGLDRLPDFMRLPSESDSLYEAQPNSKALSMNVFYQSYQYSKEYIDDERTFKNLSKTEKVRRIKEATLPILITFKWKTENGNKGNHAVVGYELEDVTLSNDMYNYEKYNQRLLLYDCELPFASNGNVRDYLYFNTETGDWKISGYTDDDGKPIDISSEYGSTLNYISDDYERLKNMNLNNLNDTKYRLDIPFNTLLESPEEDKGDSLSATALEEIDLLDGTKSIQADGPVNIILSNNTENILVLCNGVFQSVDIPVCSTVELKKSGEIIANDINGEFCISYVSDLSDSDLLSLSATGEKSSSFSMIPSEKGIVIAGDNLRKVSLQISDGKNERTISPITSSENVEVSVSGEEIIVSEDTDKDGQYETIISQTPFEPKGSFDNGVTWSIEDGVMNVSGTGVIPDFESFVSTPWYNYRNDIRKVRIGEGITRIGKGAFCSRKSLLRAEGDEKGMDTILEVSLPSTLKEIGKSAFENCNQIKSIIIPDEVSIIEDAAFYHCYSLETVSFGKHLSEIGGAAFCGCTHLTEIEIPSSVRIIEDGKIGYPDEGPESIILGCPIVDSGAFANCTALQSVVYQTDADIADLMFYGCTALAKLELIGTPQKIGEFSFYNCGFSALIIPKSVEEIGIEAYSHNRNLTEVYFQGDAPIITGINDSHENVFYEVQADAFYMKDNATWSQEACDRLDPSLHPVYDPKADSYDQNPGKLTWHPLASLTASEAVISIQNQTYTGSEQKPEPVVMVGTAKLAKDIDYTVSYKNNIKAGKATVIVTGKGNYTGSVSQTFTINQASNAITANSFTRSYSTKAQTLTLNAKATGGKLTYKSNKSAVKVNSAGKVTVGAKFSGTATITITAGDSNFATATKKITITVPTATKLTSVKNNASKKITVKWKKNTKVTGYQIQYGLKSSFSGAKKVTISKNSTVAKAIKSLKKGKKYYVRIRSYKTVGGKKYYSAWSAKKAVTIKK